MSGDLNASKHESFSDAWLEVLGLAESLEEIAKRLRVLGTYSVAATAMVVASSAIVMSLYRLTYEEVQAVVALIPTLLAALAFGLLAVFDRIKRQGDALYEELSEEVQYRLQSLARDDVALDEQRPPIFVRVIIREYARSRSLPFLGAKSGPGALAAIALACAVLPAIILNL